MNGEKVLQKHLNKVQESKEEALNEDLGICVRAGLCPVGAGASNNFMSTDCLRWSYSNH